MLTEVANYVPALAALVAKCSGTRPAAVFIRMDSRKTKTIACSSGVQQGGPMGPETLCLAFLLEPDFEREGLKAFAYMDDMSRYHGVRASTSGDIAFLWRELDNIGTVANPAKTVVLPSK